MKLTPADNFTIYGIKFALNNSTLVTQKQKQLMEEVTAAQALTPNSAAINPATGKVPNVDKEQRIADTVNATEKIERFLSIAAHELQFSVDKESDIPIVKVIDRETKKVIRQIPSEEAIDISKELHKLNGFLIKNQA